MNSFCFRFALVAVFGLLLGVQSGCSLMDIDSLGAACLEQEQRGEPCAAATEITGSTPCEAGQCTPLTECEADEFEAKAPTATEDRVCMSLAQCEPGTYVASKPTRTRDRYCAPCPQGTFSDTSNASHCTDWQVCPTGQVEDLSPTATHSRTCRPCPPNQYESEGVCVPVSECGPAEYEVSAPTPDKDRVCASCAMAPEGACTPVFTVESYWSQGWFLKVDEEGQPISGGGTTNDPSAWWVLERVFDAYYRIRPYGEAHAYLHIEHGALELSPILPDWHSAQWQLVVQQVLPDESELEHKVVKIRNRGNPDHYLHIQYGPLMCGEILSGWWSARWIIQELE